MQQIENDFDTPKEVDFPYILKNIWTNPREVFKRIQYNDYHDYKWLILALGLLAGRLNNLQQKGIAEDTTVLYFTFIQVLLPASAGILIFYIFSWIISIIGELLKGQVYSDSIFRLMAYVQIPAVISLALTVPWIAVYGLEFFHTPVISRSDDLFVKFLFGTYATIQTVIGLYTAVLFIIGLAEIQKFSIGKSIISITAPVLLLILLFAFLIFPLQS